MRASANGVEGPSATVASIREGACGGRFRDTRLKRRSHRG